MPVSRRRVKKPSRNERRKAEPYKLVLSYIHGNPDGSEQASIEYDRLFTTEHEARQCAIRLVTTPCERHQERKAELYQGSRRISRFEPMSADFEVSDRI